MGSIAHLDVLAALSDQLGIPLVTVPRSRSERASKFVKDQ
jgi:hypothetical protein